MNFPLLIKLALLSLLASCSVLPDRPVAPALHDFGFGGTVSKPLRTEAFTPWSSVKVEAPDWLHSENIRYRLLYADPTHVRFYAHDRWIAPPPTLLAQRLDRLGSGKGYDLKIKLLEFEQVFNEPRQARMVLSFRAQALRPGQEAVISEQSFQVAQPTSSADAQGAVAATEILVEKATQALSDWLRDLPTHR